MNLVLINPPFTFFKRNEFIQSQCLGILYIAAYARQKGHNVTIIDALGEGIDSIIKQPNSLYRVGLSFEEILDRLPAAVDLIGVSVPFSHVASIAHSLIAFIKKHRQDLPIIMGGVYPSTQPELAMQSKADFIAMGEGEIPVSLLLENMSRGVDELPEGIYATAETSLQHNFTSFYSKDITSYPFPARDLIDFQDYSKRSPRNLRGWKTASIVTSRGCPFDCEFCSVHPVCGYNWRPRTPEDVLEEIDVLTEKYGVTMIEIEDDNFTLRNDRAERILDGLIERKKKGRQISWQAPNGLRIDTLTEKLLDKIHLSGCNRINLALEHGNEDVIKSMNKKLKLPKVLTIANHIETLGIPCNIFVIYGYPGETRERFEKALNFYLEIKKVAPSIEFECYIIQPYPGTALLARAIREGYLPEDSFSTVEKIEQFSTRDVVWIETPDFDKEEVLRRGRKLHESLSSKRKIYRRKILSLAPDRVSDFLRTVYHIGRKLLTGA